MSTLKLVTNYRRRETLDGFSAGPEIRAEFDYIDWDAVDGGTESAEFVRYRGQWYDLGDVEVATSALKARGFDGMVTTSFFDGIAFRYFDADGNHTDGEVVVAHFYMED